MIPPQALHADFIARLELYNERAVKLEASSFLRSVLDPEVTLRLLGTPFRVVREGGPDQDSMEAFVLTLRLFVQDRDGLSFRRIKSFYDTIAVSQQLIDEVGEICLRLNHYLDGSSPLVVNDCSISRRELLTVWMNGELAHVDAKQRARLEEWTVKEDIRPFFQYEFEMVITRIARAVEALRRVNERALLELRATLSGVDA
jgi:hypothetical protein